MLKLVSVEKAIFPRQDGVTGTMLVGKGVGGKILIAIPVKAKSAYRWFVRPVTKADRKRLEKALEKIQ